MELVKNKKYLFVVPRCAEDIAGGDQVLVGNLANRLQARGDEVLILTTCAKDNRTWENHYQAGSTTEYGVPVIRFPVDDRDLDVWVPLQIKICEGMMLSVDQQLTWMQESVNSSALYEYIQLNHHDYDSIFFAPYLFGTTFWGSLICPEKSILIPCLHDEHIAYTDVIASMFRQVKGALFNANPEKDLAHSLYGQVNGAEVGMGFVPLDQKEVSAYQPYFEEDFPYIFYIGRKETGKNLHLLIDYFVNYKNENPSDLKLVITGGGSFSDVGTDSLLTRGDILDLEQVTEEEKQRLIKHCSFLCSPSTNESFSIVIMEAWQLGVPVLVHGNCAVTKDHVEESGGGLYFTNQEDFNLVIPELIENKELQIQFGQAGKEYVATKYAWDNVVKRFDQAMEILA